MTPSRGAPAAIPEAYGLRALDAGRPVTARVWRWQTDRGDVAVKTFEADEQAGGAQEAGLISFLSARPDPDYRVQTLVMTAKGEPWADQDGRRILVTQWETGHYRRHETYTPEEWLALGRCLAALHRRLDEATVPSLETLSVRLGQVEPAIELARLAPGDRHGHLPTPGQDITNEQVDSYLAACRQMFIACHMAAVEDFPADDPQRPIHNDFNQFNYLFGSALPPLIVDWEASIGAPREFEVVRCLNHLPLKAPALAASFLAGYLGVRPLRPERMRWAVAVSCLMHSTKHWVLQGWRDGRPGYDERLRGAMEMVSMLARRRADLVDFFIAQVEDLS